MSSQKRILLFNINTFKTSQIKQICTPLGISVISVTPAQYCQKLGCIAGITGFKKENLKYTGGELPSEMLVFSGMNSNDIDVFLEKYKEASIPPIGLKAVITMHNIFWNVTQLHNELLKEHTLSGSK